MTTQSVTRHGLRSMDSGTHTCNAADVWGHSGTGTIVMNITGKALALKVCASVAPTLSTIFIYYYYYYYLCMPHHKHYTCMTVASFCIRDQNLQMKMCLL